MNVVIVFAELGILLLLYALIDKVIFENNIKYIKFKNKITLKLHTEQ